MRISGRIPRDTTEREIRRHFDEFGRLRDIRIRVGFAFVEYSDERDARDAVDRLDGSRFLGERWGDLFYFFIFLFFLLFFFKNSVLL